MSIVMRSVWWRCSLRFSNSLHAGKRLYFQLSEDYVRNCLISDSGKKKVINAIMQQRISWEDNRKWQNAGVLVPLCIYNGRLSVLFTLRSAALSSHAGQVRFVPFFLWIKGLIFLNTEKECMIKQERLRAVSKVRFHQILATRKCLFWWKNHISQKSLKFLKRFFHVLTWFLIRYF